MNRTRWSAEEDSQLLAAIDHHGVPGSIDEDNDWKVIASYVHGRTNKQVRKRWLHSLNPDLKKTSWTKEEDNQLVELFILHGPKWALIATKIPGRTDDACSKRYRDALDPDLRTGAWDTEEDNKLLEIFSRIGSKWREIGQEMNRSSLHCRNRWRLLERRQKSNKATSFSATTASTSIPGAPDTASGLESSSSWYDADLLNTPDDGNVQSRYPASDQVSAPGLSMSDPITTVRPLPPEENGYMSESDVQFPLPIFDSLSTWDPIVQEPQWSYSASYSQLSPGLGFSPSAQADSDFAMFDISPEFMAPMTDPPEVVFNPFDPPDMSDLQVASGQPFQPTLLPPDSYWKSFQGLNGQDDCSLETFCTASPLLLTTSTTSPSTVVSSSLPSPECSQSSLSPASQPSSELPLNKVSALLEIDSAASTALPPGSVLFSQSPYPEIPSSPATPLSSMSIQKMPARKKIPAPRPRPITDPKAKIKKTFLSSDDPTIRPYSCGNQPCWSNITKSSASTFHTPTELSSHMKETHNSPDTVSTPYICGLANCGKSFKNLNGLQYHLQVSTMHFRDAISARVRTAGSQSPQTKTEACLTPCSTQLELAMSDSGVVGIEEHNRDMRSTIRMFKCTMSNCTKAYRSAGGLKYHLKVAHSGAPIPAQLALPSEKLPGIEDRIQSELARNNMIEMENRKTSPSLSTLSLAQLRQSFPGPPSSVFIESSLPSSPDIHLGELA